MLHLRPCSSFPLHIPSSSSINQQKGEIFLSGFIVEGENKLLGFKKGRSNGRQKNAVEKDSEYEVDPDKAREALRKLDEQLQSLSEKRVEPPKIRAADLNRSSPGDKEATLEISGSFLTSVATGLLIFTIFYNILFLTVIKPSIDGAEPTPSASMIQEAQQGEPTEKMSRSAEFPVEP